MVIVPVTYLCWPMIIQFFYSDCSFKEFRVFRQFAGITGQILAEILRSGCLGFAGKIQRRPKI